MVVYAWLVEVVEVVLVTVIGEAVTVLVAVTVEVLVKLCERLRAKRRAD